MQTAVPTSDGRRNLRYLPGAYLSATLNGDPIVDSPFVVYQAPPFS